MTDLFKSQTYTSNISNIFKNKLINTVFQVNIQNWIMFSISLGMD